MIRADQFNITSKVRKKRYEDILNSELCNIKRKEIFKDTKSGDVIVYLEWDDIRSSIND